ncbi:orotidine-5'-phosphate decarboxylase [Aeribacillus composti]|uniref:orotidine-5'-phosphate decarboxylase n=1 Tax=Aeribacillus composti TaxID=1868734 RepID=UPI001398FD3B|nr:orotidine 5'-phosphate decarboxylase [Aeribacillus pallidus]
MKNRPLILALDFDTREKALQFVQIFEEPLFVKVGMELFYQEGPSIIEELQRSGHQIFLDLKLHDIPNTVKQTMKGLAKLGVDLITIHAAGGRDMMEAAIEGLEAGAQSGNKRPDVVAVTQLTSTSSEMLKNELLIEKPLLETVLHYAENAKKSGMSGVVCSVHEVSEIRKTCGPSFLTVTPGIRLAKDRAQDQVRIATPKFAKEQGASAIVVGRTITKAEDPIAAYNEVKKEWEGKVE